MTPNQPKPLTHGEAADWHNAQGGRPLPLERVLATIDALATARENVARLTAECQRWQETLGEAKTRASVALADRDAHRARADALAADVERLTKELSDATRVCDKPGCLAAVIKRESTGHRECARGHASRWCEKTDLDAARAEARGLREALEVIESGVWDRLYANGPLSKEYAQSIAAKVKAALADTRAAAEAHDEKTRADAKRGVDAAWFEAVERHTGLKVGDTGRWPEQVMCDAVARLTEPLAAEARAKALEEAALAVEGYARFTHAAQIIRALASPTAAATQDGGAEETET